MYIDTEGIVLRQTQTVNGRRMITVFTDRYGKLSCGTSVNEGGKNKTALALRPFCRGRYNIYKSRDNYSINNAEAVQSYFEIGEDVDKYLASSYVLELTDKLLPEEEVSEQFYSLLFSYLEAVRGRKKAFETLVAAYQIKALQISGCAPVVTECVRCGRNISKDTESDNSQKTDIKKMFSITEGGCVCSGCAAERDDLDPLIFRAENDIIKSIDFFETHPFSSLEKLALKPQTERVLRKILKQYISHHLGISDLKSEQLRMQEV